jgi:hypothetical protein
MSGTVKALVSADQPLIRRRLRQRLRRRRLRRVRRLRLLLIVGVVPHLLSAGFRLASAGPASAGLFFTDCKETRPRLRD